MADNFLDSKKDDPAWREVICLCSGLFDSQDERENFILELLKTNTLLAAECKNTSVQEEGELKSQISREIYSNLKKDKFNIQNVVALLELEDFGALKELVFEYVIFTSPDSRKFFLSLYRAKPSLDWVSLVEYLVQNRMNNSASALLFALVKQGYTSYQADKNQKIYDKMYALDWKIQQRLIIFISKNKLNIHDDTLFHLKKILSRVLSEDSNWRKNKNYPRGRVEVIADIYRLFTDKEIIDLISHSQSEVSLSRLLSFSVKDIDLGIYLLDKVIDNVNYPAIKEIYAQNKELVHSYGIDSFILNMIESDNMRLFSFGVHINKRTNTLPIDKIISLYENEPNKYRRNVIYKEYHEDIDIDIEPHQTAFIQYFNAHFRKGVCYSKQEIVGAVFNVTGLTISTLFKGIIANKHEYLKLLFHKNIIADSNDGSFFVLEQVSTDLFNIDFNFSQALQKSKNKLVDVGELVTCYITAIKPSRVYVSIPHETRVSSIYIGELTDSWIHDIFEYKYKNEKMYVGQRLTARVVSIDSQDRINLSLRAV